MRKVFITPPSSAKTVAKLSFWRLLVMELTLALQKLNTRQNSFD
jgi:hypothetical protein